MLDAALDPHINESNDRANIISAKPALDGQPHQRVGGQWTTRPPRAAPEPALRASSTAGPRQLF
jgi:hypothetical protein